MVLKFGVGLIGLLLSHLVWAAPLQVELHYDVFRNGHLFARVSEHFYQQGTEYHIESLTEGDGLAALLGKRVLQSTGVVGPEGLRPNHFELHQGNNEKKASYVEFDWASNQLLMKNNGNLQTETLVPGVQDLVSFSYQWMFVPPSTADIALPVTTGKKLRIYHYQVEPEKVLITTNQGEFNTVHLVGLPSEGKPTDKEFWLAVDYHYLPVKIIQRDEQGNEMIQTLTHIKLDGI
jgi:Protein of unknown function (DUF3108)